MTEALAKIDPGKPVQTMENYKALLEEVSAGAESLVPGHVEAQKMQQMLYQAATSVPDLVHCTAASLKNSILVAFQLGLDVGGPMQQAWVLPFNTSRKVGGQWVKIKEAQFIVGYRGLAKLARNSGEIAVLEAEVVKENDHFLYRKGTDPTLEFTPARKDRGETIGVYALAKMRDGTYQTEYMSVEDVEKIRSAAMSGNSPAWKGHWDEMARKTVFRRLCKWLELSPDKAFLKAMEVDNEDYRFDAQKRVGGASAQVVSIEGATATERLLKKLDAAPIEEDEEPQEEATEEDLKLTEGEIEGIQKYVEKHAVDQEKLFSYLVQVEELKPFESWSEALPPEGGSKVDLKKTIRSAIEHLSEV